eukprot:TRINITY_DN37130_c0_g1_i1.p1 TRINITY_DN37130_c0_g1~~TRINITY_DN37130_c0_g1_i1.p1  ORF type:complete len:417 (-),score=69.77 TRINITY_DN37130_c0_g1_i1:121-1371(-)
MANGLSLRVTLVDSSNKLIRCIKPKKSSRSELKTHTDQHFSRIPKLVQRRGVVLGEGPSKADASRRQTGRPRRVLLPFQEGVVVKQDDTDQQPIGRLRTDLVEVPPSEADNLRHADLNKDADNLVSLLEVLRMPSSPDTAPEHETSSAWAERLAALGELPEVQEEVDEGLHEFELGWRLEDIPETLQVKSTSVEDAKPLRHGKIVVQEPGKNSVLIPSASALTEDLHAMLAQVGVPPNRIPEPISHVDVTATFTEQNLDVQNNWNEIIADKEVESVFGQTLQRLTNPVRRIQLVSSRLDTCSPPPCPEKLLSRKGYHESEAHGSRLSHLQGHAAPAPSPGQLPPKSSLRLEPCHKPFGGRLWKHANLSLPRVVGPKTFYNADWTVPRSQQIIRRAAGAALQAAKLQAARLRWPDAG